MPRVVAGTAKGIPLRAPPGRDTRPTSDRVKEALFSILAPEIPGSMVLDLYAGTGQLAIEALSRGAAAATLVDSARDSLECIRENLARTRTADRATVVGRSVAQALVRLSTEGRRYDIVFLDPPYAQAIAHFRDAAVRLQEGGLLAEDAVVLLEHDAGDAPDADVINLKRYRSCKYGGTMLTFYRRGLSAGSP